MIRIILISIFSLLITTTIFSQQKEFKIGATASYVSPPFSRISMTELGMGYFDYNIKSIPSFKAGLSIKKSFPKFDIGFSFDYLYTGFEMESEIEKPNVFGREGELENMHESSYKHVYNYSSIWGLEGVYKYNDFEFGLGLKLLAINATRNFWPKLYPDVHKSVSILKTSVPLHELVSDKQILGASSHSIRENHDFYELSKERLIPELIINYKLTENIHISTGMYAKFWSKRTAYTLTVDGFNTFDEALNHTRDSEDVSFNDRRMNTKFIAGHIGIRYELSVKRNVKEKRKRKNKEVKKD